jgi:hypothetical protein
MQSLSNIWRRKTAGEKKMTNQLCVLCVVKNCYLLITIFPMANIRRAYAGIGILRTISLLQNLTQENGGREKS